MKIRSDLSDYVTLINFDKVRSVYHENQQSGPLAQSVEQRTFNPWVVGSIPTGPTKNVSDFQMVNFTRRKEE
jgi:hypothetical protein